MTATVANLRPPYSEKHAFLHGLIEPYRQKYAFLHGLVEPYGQKYAFLHGLIGHFAQKYRKTPYFRFRVVNFVAQGMGL